MKQNVNKKFNSLSHKISEKNNNFRSIITVDYGSNKTGFNNKFPEFYIFIHPSEFEIRNLTPSIDNSDLIALDFIKNLYNDLKDLDLIDFKKVTLKNGEILKNEVLFE